MAGSDLFTGTLDLLILTALARGPRYGYAIARWIRETTSDALVIHEGVLYEAPDAIATGASSIRLSVRASGRD